MKYKIITTIVIAWIIVYIYITFNIINANGEYSHWVECIK